jgi:hypothetical protein
MLSFLMVPPALHLARAISNGSNIAANSLNQKKDADKIESIPAFDLLRV